MANHEPHNNLNLPGKSSDCPGGFCACRKEITPLKRRLYRWGGLLGFLCLLGMLWTVADIRAEDEQKPPDQPTAEKQSDSDKQDPNQSPEQQKPQSDQPISQDQDAAEEDKDHSAENALFEIFEQYAQAEDKDPNSPEAQALAKKLEEAMATIREKMESDPDAPLRKLPSAPDQPPTAQQASAPQAPPAQPSVEKKTSADEITPTPLPIKKPAESVASGGQTATIPSSSVTPAEKVSAPAENISMPQEKAPTPADKVTTPPKEVPVSAAQPPELPQPAPRSEAPTPPAPEAGKTAPPTPSQETPSKPADVPPPRPDDIVQLKIEDSQLDIQYLLDFVGKEMNFNFLYETTEPITGKVLLQMYGDIHRRDLMPLLESVLSFRGYVLVQEGAFVRVTKRETVDKKTQSVMSIGPQLPELGAGDTIVTQIIEVKYVPMANLTSLLERYISTPNSMIPIPNTNYLIITEYAQRMSRLLELYQLIDQPGPAVILVPLKVQYLKAQDARNRIEELLKALSAQGASPVTPGGPASPTTPDDKGRPARPPLPSRAPAPTPASPQGPTIFVDQENNRLLIVGTEEQINQVSELLGIIDLEPPVPDIQLVPVPIKYVLAQNVAQQIQTLLKSLDELRGESAGPTPAAPAPAVPAPAAPPGARTTPPKEPSAPADRSAAGKGPVIHVDERTNRMFIIGTAQQVEEVMELLALLDVVEGPEIKLSVLRVRHVEAKEVAGQIDQLIKALIEQGAETAAAKPATAPKQPAPPPDKPEPARSGTPSASAKVDKKVPAIFVDERTSRLLVVGSDEQIAQVEELLALLDVAEGPEIKLVDIRVKHVLADEVAGQIEDLLEALSEQRGSSAASSVSPSSDQTIKTPPPPAEGRTTSEPRTTTSTRRKILKEGPAIFVDERTNRLLVVGSEEQFNQVRQLLALLDVVEGPEIKLVAIEVKFVMADDIADQLDDLMNAFAERSSEIEPANTTQNNRQLAQPQRTPTGMTGDQRLRTDSSADRRTQRTSSADRRTQRTSSAGRDGRSGGAGPFILVDDRTNRLLVVGSDEQIEQLRELLKILDVPPSEYDRLVLRIFQPQFVEAAEVERILDQLGITKPKEPSYRDKVRQERQGAEPAGRGLLGPEPAPTAGEGELPGLAGLPGPTRLLPGQEEPEIRIAVQETTNRIFVLATEYQMRNIEEILKHVDIEPEEALGAIQVYPLENREPEEVAGMLKELLDARREQQEEGVEQKKFLPGAEGAPVIVPFEKTYALVVHASKKQHEEIGKIIEVLDKRLPQVLVEAILVQVSASDALNLGIQLQQTYDIGGDKTRRISGISPFGIKPTLNSTGNFVTGTGGTIAFFDDEVIYATLEALQTKGNTKVVSMPRITVNDNETANITSERKEPTTRTTIPAGSDTPIIEFKDYVNAGTTLNITPNISEGDFLRLTINLSVNSFDGQGSANVPPPQSNNSIETIVTVPDRKTIVLGGLTTSTNSMTVNKIPLLGDLPLVGGLFRSVSSSESEAVLYVFVKAHIIRSDIPGETDHFEDLDNLSEKYRNKLKGSELEYRQQSSLIPGLPPEKRNNEAHVLDD